MPIIKWHSFWNFQKCSIQTLKNLHLQHTDISRTTKTAKIVFFTVQVSSHHFPEWVCPHTPGGHSSHWLSSLTQPLASQDNSSCPHFTKTTKGSDLCLYVSNIDSITKTKQLLFTGYFFFSLKFCKKKKKKDRFTLLNTLFLKFRLD